MGCCLSFFSQPPPESEPKQVPNDSRLVLNHSQIPPDSPKTMASKHKDEGKKYFNAGNFVEAIKAYQLALEYDSDSLVNYTNLALAQKALRKFQESISTITKMEAKAKPSTSNITTITKGKIIKARCQSILVKSFCLKEKIPPGLTLQKCEKLIKESVNSLTNLLENSLSKQSAMALKAENYLNNSKNICTIFESIKNRSQTVEKVIDYFKIRLESKQSQVYFNTLDMQKYVEKPTDILEQLDKIRLARQKQLLRDDDEQQQFTIDPITYEKFSVPILVKSGFTYEESTLKNHYGTNGVRDPITKQNFNDEFGVSNLTLAAYISQTKRLNVTKQLKQIEL